jgi:hypothetical protein
VGALTELVLALVGMLGALADAVVRSDRSAWLLACSVTDAIVPDQRLFSTLRMGAAE